MCIYRGILHDNIFRHVYPEGGKVPHGFDTARHHTFGHSLCLLDRNGQNTDTYGRCGPHGGVLIDVINGNPVDGLTDDSRIDIEAGNNLQTVLGESFVVQQGTAQITHTKQVSLAGLPEPKKVFQDFYQAFYIVTYPGFTGNIQQREVFGYL